MAASRWSKSLTGLVIFSTARGLIHCASFRTCCIANSIIFCNSLLPLPDATFHLVGLNSWGMYSCAQRFVLAAYPRVSAGPVQLRVYISTYIVARFQYVKQLHNFIRWNSVLYLVTQPSSSANSQTPVTLPDLSCLSSKTVLRPGAA